MKNFYLLACFVGTLLPWFFFGNFILANGFTPILFVQSLFANSASAGFSTDLIIALLVFLFWSYCDAKKRAIKQWWWILPASFAVGLSLALPLYLYLTEQQKEAL